MISRLLTVTKILITKQILLTNQFGIYNKIFLCVCLHWTESIALPDSNLEKF